MSKSNTSKSVSVIGSEDRRCHILGVPVSVITMDSAIARLRFLADKEAGSYVCVTDVYNIMVAQRDDAHRKVLQGADMVTPDGSPLSWVARSRGVSDIRRVCGPDLFAETMDVSRRFGWKHYFLGGAEGVPERLAERMREAFPGVQIVGTYSPPFRRLTAEEDETLVANIRQADPDFLWIGLGCPKQERWMADHVDRLPGIVQIGVGAAFNFHSGEIARAPSWMRKNGLEWLHRLKSEPRRLWKRYLLHGPAFMLASSRESWKLSRSI